MIAAIISPGPSLAAFPVIEADVRIAINRAILLRPAEWWACLDLPLLREIPQGAKVFTRAEYSKKVSASRTVESLRDFCPIIDRLSMFTVPSAIILAGWLVSGTGGGSINIFGCDMTGDGGADGVMHPARTESRWARERPLFSEAVAFVRDRGVTVVNHGLELCTSLQS